MDLSEIRKKLEDERRNLLRALQSVHEADAGDANPDEMDLAAQTANQEVSLSLGHFDDDLIERIDKALGRLEAGTYGKCLACGDEIQGERLLTLPFAELCVRCQSRLEEKKK